MFQHIVSGDIISKSWAVPAENIFRYLPNIIQMTPQANLADIFSHMHNNGYWKVDASIFWQVIREKKKRAINLNDLYMIAQDS